MINEQVMTDTVLRLLEAGIDDATIVATLTDAGISETDAGTLLLKAKAAKAKPVAVQPAAPQRTATAAPEVQILREQLATQNESHALHQDAVNAVLDDHEEKLAGVAQDVEMVKSTLAAQQQPQTGNASSPMGFRISELEKKVDDLSASSKAMRDLLQKILETDRKILTNLEMKK